MIDIQQLVPLTVHGSQISYFTGKLEMYLRYQQIPYKHLPLSFWSANWTIPRATGITQIPAVQLGDGRWMTDSTAIIHWFEESTNATAVIPEDPEQRFFSLLLEDYADEWLWRPAMHYRWFYSQDAMHLSRIIIDEMFANIPVPAGLKRAFFRNRQRRYYTRGDGIKSAATVKGVEAIYLRSLQQLQSIFEKRPFLLGDKPSLADFGFSGSMYRHFGLDPTPSAMMRAQAPAVYEWLARLWNTSSQGQTGDWLTGIPDDWSPILDEIAQAYLPYLNANARAYQRGEKHFDATIDGVDYAGARVSAYRVWCLQQLQAHFNTLPDAVSPNVKSRLVQHNGWEPLFEIQDLDTTVYSENKLPFGKGSPMLGVH